MAGNDKIIEHLNLALKKELTAINQYLLHAHLLEDWGVAKLSKHEYEESVEEREHADLLIKRILFLGGNPDVQTLGDIGVAKTVKEVLQNDLKAELDGIAHYREAIAACEEFKDYGTRDLFLQILKEEEGHQDYLETQLKMVEDMGLQNYLQINSQSSIETEE